MKNKSIDFWLLTNISVMLGEACDTDMDNIFYWHLNDGSVVELDFKEKEIRFVDWMGDNKTYYALIGITTLRQFKHGDYLTNKLTESK